MWLSSAEQEPCSASAWLLSGGCGIAQLLTGGFAAGARLVGGMARAGPFRSRGCWVLSGLGWGTSVEWAASVPSCKLGAGGTGEGYLPRLWEEGGIRQEDRRLPQAAAMSRVTSSSRTRACAYRYGMAMAGLCGCAGAGTRPREGCFTARAARVWLTLHAFGSRWAQHASIGP